MHNRDDKTYVIRFVNDFSVHPVSPHIIKQYSDLIFWSQIMLCISSQIVYHMFVVQYCILLFSI